VFGSHVCRPSSLYRSPTEAPDRVGELLDIDGPAPVSFEPLYIRVMYNSGMSKVEPKRSRRINMRVSDRQESILRAAAELSGETLTGFVLSVATERAQDVVERSQRIEVSTAEFERFVAALDGPADDMPALRKHASKPSQIPPH
jgi:uncharacterized protein (DUF1778 family)